MRPTLGLPRGDVEYCLTSMVINAPAFIPLTEGEYEAIARAKQGLLDCLSIEEKFDLVVENYLELEMALLQTTLRHSTITDDRHDTDDDRGLLNRRLANLLSSGRAYIDQVGGHLSGVVPARMAELSAAFSREYDARLGYRVMEALRNHTQHCGSPVRLTTYGARFVTHGERKCIAYTVDPYIRSADLVEDEQFKKSVLKELQGHEKIELKPLVREYVEGLWKVQNEIREWVGPLIDPWETALADARAKFAAATSDDRTPFGIVAAQVADDGEFTSRVAIVSEFSDYRRYLERKSFNLEGLPDRYVSTESSGREP